MTLAEKYIENNYHPTDESQDNKLCIYNFSSSKKKNIVEGETDLGSIKKNYPHCDLKEEDLFDRLVYCLDLYYLDTKVHGSNFIYRGFVVATDKEKAEQWLDKYFTYPYANEDDYTDNSDHSDNNYYTDDDLDEECCC